MGYLSPGINSFICVPDCKLNLILYVFYDWIVWNGNFARILCCWYVTINTLCLLLAETASDNFHEIYHKTIFRELRRASEDNKYPQLCTWLFTCCYKQARYARSKIGGTVRVCMGGVAPLVSNIFLEVKIRLVQVADF